MSQKTYSMRSKSCKKKESEDFVWGQKKKKQSCSSSCSKRKVEGSNIGNVEDEVKFLSTPQNADENRSLISTTPPNDVSGVKLYSAVVDGLCKNNLSEESSLITETSNNLTSSQEAAKSSKGVTTVVLNSSSEVKSVEEKEINVAPHCENIRVQTSPPTNELSSAVQQPEVKMTSTSDMCDKINNTLQDKIKIELNCPVCHIDIEVKEDGLCCDSCHCWFHKNCLHSAEITGDAKSKDSSKWICVRCQSILANRVKWGDLTGEMVIAQKIKLVYEEVITWSKNFFLLPRGKVGTDFIKELTKLFRLFNEKDKKWSRLALPLVHIFLP